MPLNDEWLNVKPKAPLPWDDAQMQEAISIARNLKESEAARKIGKVRNGCKEWPDCYTCPISIDECSIWYNGHTQSNSNRISYQ